jgi:hypothetical protein
VEIICEAVGHALICVLPKSLGVRRVGANTSKGRTFAMVASIRSVRPLLASIRKYARISVGSIALLLLAIGMVFCAPGSAQSTTTISGTVYMPNGTNVLPNVLVYVTTESVSAPVSGADCPNGAGCITASNAVPSGVTLFTSSAVDGTFTLNNVPVSTSYSLVIQAGKWQRQFEDVTVGTTALTGLQLAMPTVHGTIDTGSITSALPAGQTTGLVTTVNSIPLIAIATGSVDAVECVFRDVGVAGTEFTDDTVSSGLSLGGRIHLYKGDHSAGAEISSSTPSETTLMTSTTLLKSYDMAMFPCQGSTTAESSANIDNLIAYTSAGGRVFVTHDSRVWLNTATSFDSASFSGAATWLASPISSLNPDPGVATVNTGFTDGSTLSHWLYNGGYSDGNNAGAADTGTQGEVEISTLRWDLSEITAPTQSWLTMNSSETGGAAGAIMQMTFNTPVGAAADAQYGRVLFSDYHVENVSSDAGDIFPAECPTLTTSAIAQEKMLEYALFDLSNFVTAVVPPTASISITTEPVDGHFNEGDTTDTITADVTNTSSTVALPANTTFSITLPAGLTATAMTDPTGGWICTVGTLTCTRSTTMAASTSDAVTVTVSVSSTATQGAETSTGTVTAQVASTNFSSNVTSPITLTLVQAAAVSWPTPAAISYGTPLGGMQLNAVGNAPSGSYVYTPLAGTVLSAGSQTLSVVYTPGSTFTSSFPGTGTASVTLVVNPALETVVLSGLTQNFTGSPVVVTAATSPTALPVTYSYTYTGISPTVYGPTSTPPTADGSYTVVATIASGQNYTGTSSGTLVISGSATLDATSTTVQISPSRVMAGQPVTLTATIADMTSPGTIPSGSVTFTDTTTSTMLNGGSAVTLNGSGAAVLTGIVLSGAGAHTITAAYSGVSGFFASSTNTAQVQVGLSSFVGTALTSYPVTVTITAAGTPANISVVTTGAPNLDFTDAVTGDTCISSSPSVGQTCTVDVNFTPQYPGPRYGAVVITDGSGNVLGTAYLQGTGTGPQVTFANTTQGNFAPNSISTLGGSFSFSNPTGMTIDASGDVFIADMGNHAVEKIPFTAGVYGAPITLASSFTFNSPYGVAVDGAGNVFVSDNGGQAMYEILAAGGYTTVNPLGNSTSNSNPKGIAVDGAGNVYVSGSNNAVYEILAAGGYTTVNELGGGFLNPGGVAVDAAGDIFVADSNNSAIKEMPAGCASSACVTQLASIGYPAGLAIDGAGDLYVANGTEVLAGGSYATSFSLPPSISNATSVAVASNGNVFFTNGNTVEEFDYADAPSLGYATSTPLGEQDTTDGTQTVTVTNIGNASLAFASVSYAVDFPELSGASGACSTSAQLITGTGCTLPVNFAPTSTTGPLSESLVLTDNNLNATTTPGTQRTIALSGTAFAAVAATQSIATTVLTQNHAAALFTPVTGSGGSAPLTYSVSSGLPTGLMFNASTGAITGTPNVTSTATTYTVTVTDANGATAQASFSLTVDSAVVATQAIATTVLTQNHAAARFTPVTGSGGLAPLTYSVSSGLPTGLMFNTSTGAITGTASVTSGATSYTVTVTDANNATATASFSLTVGSSVVATQAIASTALTVNHAAVAFTPVIGSGGDAPLSYSVSPGLPTGLMFNASTGTITGTPTGVSGAANYTVMVTDANGATATASFSLTVDSAVAAVQAIGVESLTLYQAITPFIPVTGSGGTTPLMYSVSPGLPAGLVLNASTGVISGTPTVVSAATTYRVTVTDANGGTAQASFSLGVGQQASVTVVSANPTTATPVQSLTLSATVAPAVAGTPVTPSGTVTFFDGATQLGVPVPLAGGMAQLVVPSLPPGQTATITAVYSGDGNFLASTSSNSATVVMAPLGFTFTNTGTAAYTAAPGAVATYNFEVTPLYGSYAGPVSFSVTGLPAGATASFTPSTVAVNGGATPVVMTVQTATATAYNRNNSPLGRGMVLALLLLPFGVKRRLREKLRGQMLLLVLLLAGMTVAMTGCGSNNGFMLQSPGTYPLTVTATSGSQQQSQTVTLIVQ